MYWRDCANRAIEAAMASGRAAGLDGRDLERHVSEAYPFGPRENHPYKIWLDACRKAFGRHKPKAKAGANVVPGQGTLFGGDS